MAHASCFESSLSLQVLYAISIGAVCRRAMRRFRRHLHIQTQRYIQNMERTRLAWSRARLQPPEVGGRVPVAKLGVVGLCAFGLLFRRLAFSAILLPLLSFSVFALAFASVKTAGGDGAFSTFGVATTDVVPFSESAFLAAAALVAAASSSALRFLTTAADEVKEKLPG